MNQNKGKDKKRGEDNKGNEKEKIEEENYEEIEHLNNDEKGEGKSGKDEKHLKLVYHVTT